MDYNNQLSKKKESYHARKGFLKSANKNELTRYYTALIRDSEVNSDVISKKARQVGAPFDFKGFLEQRENVHYYKGILAYVRSRGKMPDRTALDLIKREATWKASDETISEYQKSG